MIIKKLQIQALYADKRQGGKFFIPKLKKDGKNKKTDTERSGIMLSDMMDYKNSISKKIMHQDKVDPGTFSFLEPGWWVLHATTIAAIYILGSMMTKRPRGMA